jgi:hypothetical protein
MIIGRVYIRNYNTGCACATGECTCYSISGTGFSDSTVIYDNRGPEPVLDDEDLKRLAEIRRKQKVRAQKVQAGLKPKPIRAQRRAQAPKHVPTRWLQRKHS